MALRELRAYMDQEQLIRVLIDKRFDEKTLICTLETETECYPLTLLEESCQGDKPCFLFRSPVALDLEKNYQIVDQDRNRCPLGYGAIVRSQAFADLYTYEGSDLGSQYSEQETTFRLWAPISKQVFLVLERKPHAMKRAEKGTWILTLPGNWDGASYHYLHLVNGEWKTVHDPYALSSLANSGNSVVINPAKLKKPSPLVKKTPFSQSILYEMSVRDFSWQVEAGFDQPGTFSGLHESPLYKGEKIGLDYVKQLGVTHIQLMPIYDFGSVDETFPQAVYNWGYDPVQYNVPDGSFSTNPHDPYARILELQAAVAAYHEAGIGVIMDVVYNHVYNADRFAMELIVPGYFYRYDDQGKRTDGTFCGNDVASERSMVRRYILHSLKIWQDLYGMDGFRFDLMGILDNQTMQLIAKELRRKNPHCYLYGEGWQMATGLSFDKLAHQYNADQLPTISFFNDHYRNRLKEVLLNPNQLVHHYIQQDLEGLLTASIHSHFVQPSQSLNYIECHDNATLFDYLRQEARDWTTGQVKRAASFGLQLLLISQGPCFIHSGQEAFRTKQGVENSYNSSDAINQLDWERMVHYQEHVNFIRQLIAFRQQHPELSQTNYDSIQKTCYFYWLTPTLLRYTIETREKTLCFIINFSHSNTSYQKEDKQTILFNYPPLTSQESLIPLAGQSISISILYS